MKNDVVNNIEKFDPENHCRVTLSQERKSEKNNIFPY